MRHATWLWIEASPLTHELYGRYLLGSQELELREAVERAADGYYAVQLALRLPQPNGVADRLVIAGLCTVDMLRDRLAAASQPQTAIELMNERRAGRQHRLALWSKQAVRPGAVPYDAAG